MRDVEPRAPPFELNSNGLLRASRNALLFYFLKEEKKNYFPPFFGLCVVLNAFVPVRAPATHHWLMMSHPALFCYSPNAALRVLLCVRVLCVRIFGVYDAPIYLESSPLLFNRRTRERERERKKRKEKERALIGWHWEIDLLLPLPHNPHYRIHQPKNTLLFSPASHTVSPSQTSEGVRLIHVEFRNTCRASRPAPPDQKGRD